LRVKPDYRERCIGTKLVNAIKSDGIQKIHCLVKRDNLIAQQFWEACGFELREDVFDDSCAV
jgi:ribosomal protein S18 acetylase RimI-like enzyme